MKDFHAPDEHGAQERTWEVVGAAFAGRVPARRRRHLPVRAALVLAVVAALTAVAFTPPGHAVLTSVRKVIGVEHAQPALYRLPTAGRILAGGWLVNADGSTRHLGDYDETTWSPFGRFIAGAKPNQLVALEANGDVRWTLPWIDHWQRPDDVVDALRAFAAAQPEPPVLYPQTDGDLLLVSRQRARLADLTRFVLADEQLVEDLVDKSRFADLAQRFIQGDGDGIGQVERTHGTQGGNADQGSRVCREQLVRQPGPHAHLRTHVGAGGDADRAPCLVGARRCRRLTRVRTHQPRAQIKAPAPTERR